MSADEPVDIILSPTEYKISQFALHLSVHRIFRDDCPDFTFDGIHPRNHAPVKFISQLYIWEEDR